MRRFVFYVQCLENHLICYLIIISTWNRYLPFVMCLSISFSDVLLALFPVHFAIMDIGGQFSTSTADFMTTLLGCSNLNIAPIKFDHLRSVFHLIKYTFILHFFMPLQMTFTDSFQFQDQNSQFLDPFSLTLFLTYFSCNYSLA